jgi:DnaJ-domain-containing protein 1
LSLSTQFVVAYIVLLGMTSIVTFSVFFITLRYWAVQILRCDAKLRERINLIVGESGLSWKINLENHDSAWPSDPLEWATVAALSTILIETILFGKESGARILWYVAGVTAATIALSIPFIVAQLWTEKVQQLVKVQLASLVTPRTSTETDVVKEIFGLWHDILDCFTAIGGRSRIDADKKCRDILFRRARGGTNDDTLRRLVAFRAALATYLEELRYWAGFHETAQQEFAWATNAVINNGSATLVGELDRIRGWMNSECLIEALNRNRWEEAHQLLGQIRFDLKMLRNAVEGGNEMPQTLEDAYRLLNVNSATSNKVIKAVVDALRRVWHPDLTSDTGDREQRTAKMQQINAAWDIILEGRAVNGDFCGRQDADGPEAFSSRG